MSKIQAISELQKLLAGLQGTPQMLKQFLNLVLEGDATGSEKLKALKVLRFSLLEDIHDKQQLLDNVDYALYRIKREGKSSDDD